MHSENLFGTMIKEADVFRSFVHAFRGTCRVCPAYDGNKTGIEYTKQNYHHVTFTLWLEEELN